MFLWALGKLLLGLALLFYPPLAQYFQTEKQPATPPPLNSIKENIEFSEIGVVRAIEGGGINLRLENSAESKPTLVISWHGKPDEFVMLLWMDICGPGNDSPFSGQRVISDRRIFGDVFIMRCTAASGERKISLAGPLRPFDDGPSSCCLALAVPLVNVHVSKIEPETGTKQDAAPTEVVAEVNVTPQMLEKPGVVYVLEQALAGRTSCFVTPPTMLNLPGSAGHSVYVIEPVAEHHQWARVNLVAPAR